MSERDGGSGVIVEDADEGALLADAAKRLGTPRGNVTIIDANTGEQITEAEQWRSRRTILGEQWRSRRTILEGEPTDDERKTDDPQRD